MAAYKFGAVGMAGGIIALAAIAAWLGLAHTCDPQGGGGGHRGTGGDLPGTGRSRASDRCPCS